MSIAQQREIEDLKQEVRRLNERLSLLECWYVKSGGVGFLHESRKDDEDIVKTRPVPESTTLSLPKRANG